MGSIFSLQYLFVFLLISIIGVPAFSQDQACETQLYTLISDAKANCESWSNTCEPGVYISKGVPIFSNTETIIKMRCQWVLCATGEVIETVSPNYFQKCESQLGVEPKKILESIYKGTNQCGSIIQAENRILGESVSVVGTNFDMNYFTSWVEGRTADYAIEVSLAAAMESWLTYTVPVTYDMKVYVGGSTSPAMSQINITDPDVGYLWNGLDANGNPTLGGVSAKTVITSQTQAGPIDMENNFSLGSLKAKYLGLGGWLPSNFYYYDPNSKMLYSGDGEKQKVKVYPWINNGFYLPIEEVTKIVYFDSTGRVGLIKSGLLGTTLATYNYDSSGRLNSIVESFGRTTTFNRDSVGNFISITAPNGKITTVTLDNNGYLASITNPMNQAHNMSYYGNQGLMHTFTKPGAQVSTFEYDQYGNLATDTHSGGFFWTLFKDAQIPDTINSVLQTPMGRTTNYIGSYDGDTVNSREVLPSGGTNRYGRNFGGSEHVKQGITLIVGNTIDPRFMETWYGNSTTYRDQVRVSVGAGLTRQAVLQDVADPFSIVSYSLDHYLTPSFTATTQYNTSLKTFTTTTGGGKTNIVGIDVYERTIYEKQGNLTAVQYGYTNEKLTSITQGSRVGSFAYNSTTGYLESITNPLNQATLFSYDNAGKLTGSVGPDLRSITYQYDSNGNVSGITPFGRPMHQFSMNASELSSGYQPPTLTGVSNVNTAYSYNLDKQLTQILKPNGQSVNYTYDLTTGLMTGYTSSAGSYQVTLNWDTQMPTTIITPNGYFNTFEWANTEIVTNRYKNASDVQIYAYRKNYQYDGLLLSDAVENSGSTVSTIAYTFNNDQDLTKAGDMVLAYNTPNGQLATVKMGSGTTGFTDTYTYNTFGEVTGYNVKRGTTTIYDMNLTRDALGRIDTKTQVMNGITDAYAYVFDLAARLQQVTKNSSVVANYGYDSNSNRNSGNVGAQTTTATYDDQDRLTAYNSLTFTYNANGDLVSKTNTVTSTTTQYTYDVFGNLTQVVLPGGTTTISYEIDAFNRRVGMKINNVLQKRWVYMDQYRIAAELSSSGTITKRFVYGSKGNIPDYVIASGVKYRIISDQLGSPRLVVKQSDGTITQRMNHDEFGRVTEDTNPGYLPFGFAGGLYDNQTGLVRFGARDYDSEIGRWTAKDPVGFEGDGENLYQYVMSDPANWIDMAGTCTVCAGASVGAATGSLIMPGPGTVVGAAIGVTAAAYTTYVISQKLSKWQWGNLQDNTGQHPEDIKEGLVGEKNAGKWDLYIEPDGRIVVRPKDRTNKTSVDTDFTKDDLKPRGKCEKKKKNR